MLEPLRAPTAVTCAARAGWVGREVRGLSGGRVDCRCAQRQLGRRETCALLQAAHAAQERRRFAASPSLVRQGSCLGSMWGARQQSWARLRGCCTQVMALPQALTLALTPQCQGSCMRDLLPRAAAWHASQQGCAAAPNPRALGHTWFSTPGTSATMMASVWGSKSGASRL